MNFKALSDIIFDEQDANLFLVDDPRLRADALKHSVLPRLRVLMNTAISHIREIYGIEALDDSIVSVFPNFREKRDKELTIKYDSAFVGIGGQRKAKWPGFARKDGKLVQILPFRFAFALTQDGLFIVLENGWLKGLDKKSFGSILQFHIDNEEKINPLCFYARMRPIVVWEEDLSIFATLKEQYHYRIDHEIFDNHFIGHTYCFPVASHQLVELVYDFASFFPVYDAYIQIAKGVPDRFDDMLSKLKNWIHQNDFDESESIEEKQTLRQKKAQEKAVLFAETKIRVMPAIRWQVFQRDEWKCVSCGRNSHDGVILHVDHIIPRSRGGLDTLDNFQTLCNICNIGKGNKDDTDLRNKT
ncbi:MAG: HNH endonuclease [Dissulfurispiraceae bacterium]|jgi:hypothetical protein|nr:HNH endonuclease [Dissulfurispiraceae bacterium]